MPNALLHASPAPPQTTGAGEVSPKKPRAKSRELERKEQVAVVTWAKGAAALKWPELALLHAIPNGGDRHMLVAAKLQGEGVRRGVPDLCLPVARGGYHGLYIEMKADKGRPSEHQRWWISRLREQGYRVAVCWGRHEAINTIMDYLEGKLTITKGAQGK
ncbi:MAG: VRR-NUC domain-containing protein [Thermodesulfobacteriota bacterium]